MEADLKALWQTVFGDSTAYIDLFFRHLYKQANAVTEQQDGRIVSALHLVETELFVEGDPRKAAYLCGAATLPEYRGQGIMGRLIERAKVQAKAGGAETIVLIPAQQSLFDYYARHGFLPLYQVEHKPYSLGDGGEEIRFSPATNPQLARKLYNETFQAKPYALCKSERIFTFIFEEAQLMGHQIDWIGSADQPVGYIIYAKSDPGRVRELVCPDGQRRAVLDAFMRRHGLTKAVVTEPGTGQKKGMILPLDGQTITAKTAYINVMLDG